MPLLVLLILVVVLGHLLIALLPWLACAVVLYASIRVWLWHRRRVVMARAIDAQRVRAGLLTKDGQRRARKCIALLGSGSEGERQAALSALDRVLATEGVTYVQLADMVGPNLYIR